MPGEGDAPHLEALGTLVANNMDTGLGLNILFNFTTVNLDPIAYTLSPKA